jgi:hypothetical protein
MNTPVDEPLPQDLPACHTLIRQLRTRVANLRRLVVGSLGYDPTDTAAVNAYQQAMSNAMSKVDWSSVAQEVAAEESMRRAARRRKKK